MSNKELEDKIKELEKENEELKEFETKNIVGLNPVKSLWLI